MLGLSEPVRKRENLRDLKESVNDWWWPKGWVKNDMKSLDSQIEVVDNHINREGEFMWLTIETLKLINWFM